MTIRDTLIPPPVLPAHAPMNKAKADKLDAARAALPKKRVPVKEKIYDAASGKAKSTLRLSLIHI